LRTRKTRPVDVDRIPVLLNAPFALTLGLSHASLAPPPRARPVPRRGRAQAEEHLRGDGADAFDELGADAVPPGALGRESKHYLPAEEKWRQGSRRASLSASVLRRHLSRDEEVSDRPVTRPARSSFFLFFFSF
jgi:hypothetical protein